MDLDLIEQYAAGGHQMRRAFAGLTRDDLLSEPVPGTWSLQQIAVHLLDSDLIGSDRMKRIAAMPLPLLIGYDESAFSKLPGANSLDIDQVCDMFDRNRQFTATILRSLPDESFLRCGIHNEIGRVSLGEMVGKYIHHLEGHLAFVATKRQILGKPAAFV